LKKNLNCFIEVGLLLSNVVAQIAPMKHLKAMPSETELTSNFSKIHIISASKF